VESRDGVAARLAGRAREQAGRFVERRRDEVAQRIDRVSGALRESGQRLREGEADVVGRYVDSAAGQLDQLALYLRGRDLEAFLADVETFARRRPQLFVTGSFVAGLLLARFLKSSSQRPYDVGVLSRDPSGARGTVASSGTFGAGG
jgi:hypothetical protein